MRWLIPTQSVRTQRRRRRRRDSGQTFLPLRRLGTSTLVSGSCAEPEPSVGKGKKLRNTAGLRQCNCSGPSWADSLGPKLGILKRVAQFSTKSQIRTWGNKTNSYYVFWSRPSDENLHHDSCFDDQSKLSDPHHDWSTQILKFLHKSWCGFDSSTWIRWIQATMQTGHAKSTMPYYYYCVVKTNTHICPN